MLNSYLLSKKNGLSFHIGFKRVVIGKTEVMKTAWVYFRY